MENQEGNVTDRVKDILLQFRTNVKDVLDVKPQSDATLLKWLRIRDFNLQKSEKVFRENEYIREVHNIDSYSNHYDIPEVMEKYGFTNHIGIAKDGTPVRYIAVGRGDLYGWVCSLSGIQIARLCSMHVEVDKRILREHASKTGMEVNEFTYIMDMEGFTLSKVFNNPVIETALDLFRMLQDMYPEIWNRILVVNAPFYFRYIYNFFRPILRGTILSKISVASKDETSELLQRHIDTAQLPSSLTGLPHSYYGEELAPGGVIPRSYYLADAPGLLEGGSPGATAVVVAARSVHEHSLDVPSARSRIRMEMRTEGGSLATTMLHTPYPNDTEEEPKMRKVSPTVKLQLHLAPVSDECLAPWPGVYTFRFDNSANWLTSRFHRFAVIAPSVHDWI